MKNLEKLRKEIPRHEKNISECMHLESNRASILIVTTAVIVSEGVFVSTQ